MTLRVVLAAMAVGVALSGVSLAAAPVSVAGPPYGSCKEARDDGRSNIPKGDSAYRDALDRDGDGIACESKR